MPKCRVVVVTTSFAAGFDNVLPHSPRMDMRRDEDLAAALRRMALEQVDVARAGFVADADDDLLDNSVHLARKAGKRLRALFRLCRRELGPDTYRRANVLVRDRSRQLAPARGSRVLVDTLDRLVDRRLLARDDVAPLRELVVSRHAQSLERVRADEVGRAGAREAFAGLAGCIRDLPSPVIYATADLAALEPAIHRSFRAARRAMKVARRTDATEAFHEWRRRINHLRYQMEALSGACEPPVGELTDMLDELSELLGDDHDLGDVRCLCAAHPGLAPATLPPLLDAESRHLRRDALRIGNRVFASGPASFIRFFSEHSRPTP